MLFPSTRDGGREGLNSKWYGGRFFIKQKRRWGVPLQGLPLSQGADDAAEATLLGDSLVPFQERGRVLTVLKTAVDVLHEGVQIGGGESIDVLLHVSILDRSENVHHSLRAGILQSAPMTNVREDWNRFERQRVRNYVIKKRAYPDLLVLAPKRRVLEGGTESATRVTP